MKDFSEWHTFQISSKASTKWTWNKSEGFFRGVYPSHSSKASEKGLDAKMKDFSGVIPFKFLLRYLKAT